MSISKARAKYVIKDDNIRADKVFETLTSLFGEKSSFQLPGWLKFERPASLRIGAQFSAVTSPNTNHLTGEITHFDQFNNEIGFSFPGRSYYFQVDRDASGTYIDARLENKVAGRSISDVIHECLFGNDKITDAKDLLANALEAIPIEGHTVSLTKG